MIQVQYLNHYNSLALLVKTPNPNALNKCVTVEVAEESRRSREALIGWQKAQGSPPRGRELEGLTTKWDEGGLQYFICSAIFHLYWESEEFLKSHSFPYLNKMISGYLCLLPWPSLLFRCHGYALAYPYAGMENYAMIHVLFIDFSIQSAHHWLSCWLHYEEMGCRRVPKLKPWCQPSS